MSSNKVKSALVFDIVRYMIEDGPGIRTCIFFKGCPLKCKWCSNILGINAIPDIAFIKNNCTRCYACVNSCPNEALEIDEEGDIHTNYHKCQNCGKCVESCLYNARKTIGKLFTLDELINIVTSDSIFYRRSGGGVTATGGEILYQADFVYEFLKKCQENFLDTAIETSGFAKWYKLEKLLKVANTAFIDLKHIDSKKHFQLTGVENDLILKNIENASAFCSSSSTTFIVRMPIIPGINDDVFDLKATAEFLSKLPGIKPLVNLLPYHAYGINKYSWIGENYGLKSIKTPDIEYVTNLAEIFKKMKLECKVGGGEI